MKSCPQCGKPLGNDDRFCQECGFDTQKPVMPPGETSQPFASSTVDASSQETVHEKGKNKILFWSLIILGIAAIVAGGWYGYNRFLNKADEKEVVNIDTVKKPVITVAPAESVTTPEAVAVFVVGAKDNPQNMYPKKPTKFVLNKETAITRIITDHYNNGKGDPAGGTITMKDKDGNIIGQWEATPAANKSGIDDAKWICNININVKPGTYFIQDSNPSTWSKNALGVGFVEVIGIE